MTAALVLLAFLQDPRSSASIRGHALASATGLPLKRVQVQIARKGQRPFRTVATGRDGAFEFLNLPADSYTVTCAKKGYLTAGYGAKGPDQPRAPITLLDREEANGKDCRLQHNGSIDGLIVDEDGDPLADVDVSALLRTYRHGQPSYTRAAAIKTDDHGRYRLYELPPGRYCLQAWRGPRTGVILPGINPPAPNPVPPSTNRPANRRRPNPDDPDYQGPDSPDVSGLNLDEAALAPVFYPNGLRMNDCQPIDLRHGDEATHIDVTLRETPTFALRGKARDARTGRPIAGVVSLFPEDYGGEGRSVQTIFDGVFEFLNLIPARYRFDILVSDDRGRQRHWTKVVELEGSDKEEMLNPGVWPRVNVFVRTENGTLPDGLRVSLVPRDTHATVETATGRSGLFDFIDVIPGNYDLWIDASPRQSFFVSELASNGRDIRDSGITVSDFEKFVSVTATLDLQPAFISGRVLDESGKPFLGAGLVAWSTDPQKRLLESYFRTTFSDASGNFHLTGLVPGEYFVAIWADYDPAQSLEPEILRRLEGTAIRLNALRQDNLAGEFRITPEIRAIPESYVR